MIPSMNKTILFLMFFMALINFSCDDADEVLSTPTGGRCYLTKLTDEILCIDFADNSNATTNSNLCDSEYTHYANSNGVTGQDFTSGNDNDCNTSSSVGTCAVGTNNFIYYSPEFNATTAQTDCTSTQSGSWTLAP